MKTDVIVVAGGEWLRISSSGEQAIIDPFPRLTRPARVVVAFDHAHTGVLRFEGKKQHAAAVIERQVRQKGWVEGVSHVILHTVQTQPGGGAAYYTAVELGAWQQMRDWAREQSQHCLIYPTGNVLATVAQGHGRVLRIGRQIQVFVRTERGMVAEDAFSPSVFPEDIRLTVQSLGGDLARSLRSAGAPAPDLEWIAGGVEDIAAERELADALATETGSSIALMALESDPADADGQASALPAAVRRLGPGESVNSVIEKAAWWPEAMAVPVIAMLATVAIGLGAAGEYMKHLAAGEHEAAQRLVAEVRERQDRLEDVDLASRHQQLERIAESMATFNTGARYTPAALLRQMRRASGPLVGVQRILLEPGEDETYTLVVDGRDRSATNSGIRSFLGALRDNGWQANPLDPASTARGSFTYQLVPARRHDS